MFRPTVLLTCEVGAIYLLLVSCGWWLSRLLARWSGARASPPAAILGLVVIQAISWYLSAADIGLEALFPWLLVLAVVAVVPVLFVKNARSLRELITVGHTRVFWCDAMTAVGSYIVFVMHNDNLLARGTLSIASWNSDVASYAAVTDHLSHAGFHSPGTIAGANLGRIAQVDVHGALSYLFAAHWIVDRPYFQMVLGAGAVASILIAQSLGRLLCEWTRLPALVVALIALLPQTTYLYTYVSAMYFLSQLLGIALTITLMVVATRRPSEGGGSAVVIVVSGLMFVSLVLTYPQMVVLLPPILAVVIMACHGRDWKAGLRNVARVALGAALGLLVMAPRTKLAIDRLRLLNGVKAGWPLDGVLPWGLVGAQQGFENTVSVVTIVGSLVVVGASLAASAWVLRRDDAPWQRGFVALLATALLSYAAFYFLRGGPTYEQWKWISFLQPLVVAAIIAPVVELFMRTLQLRRIVVAVLLLSLVVVVNMNRSLPYDSTAEAQTFWVSLELGTLGDHAALRDVNEVNVDVDPYWESMWAAVALAPRTSFIVTGSYYPVSRPTAEWTLTRRPPPGWWTGSQEIRRTSRADYLLVRAPAGWRANASNPAQATIAAVVDPSTAGVGSSGRATITVQNVGTSALIASGSPAGLINIGVQALDEQDRLLDPDFARLPFLRPPYALDPGKSATLQLDLPPLPPNVKNLRFDLVDEGVTWLGDIGETQPVTVLVGR